MGKKLRIGLLGGGRIGKLHGTNIQNFVPDAEVTILADPFMNADMEAWAAGIGIPKCTKDPDEVFASNDVDAVFICSSTATHAEFIIKAAQAGKHIFCEKPIHTDVSKIKEALEAVEKAGVKLQVGFVRRFDRSHKAVRDVVASGKLGKPFVVKVCSRDPGAPPMEYVKVSGGIFVDMAVHDIDLMRWFLGSEATEVYAMGATFKHPEFREAGDDETGVAVYKFENGAIGTIHVGRTAAHGYHIETEIVGTDGSIRISPVPEANLAVLYNSNGVVTECVDSFQTRFADAYRLEVEEFVHCLIEGRKPDVTVYDGINSTKIAFATTKAWKSGKPVAI